MVNVQRDSSIVRVMVLLLISLVVVEAAQAAQDRTRNDLGVLGGLGSRTIEMHDRALTFGAAYASGSPAYTFLGDGPSYEPASLSNLFSSGIGVTWNIGEQGQLASVFMGSDGRCHAVLWEQGATGVWGTWKFYTLGALDRPAFGIRDISNLLPWDFDEVLHGALNIDLLYEAIGREWYPGQRGKLALPLDVGNPPFYIDPVDLAFLVALCFLVAIGILWYKRR